MENQEIIETLTKVIPKQQIKQNEPMKLHTSFKIGGIADIFITIETIEELQFLLKTTKGKNIKLTIIGNGSNILVTDKGIRGITAKINLKNINIKTNSNSNNIELEVDSGVTLGYIAQKLLKEEISGFEELSGIPGKIGGAIVMNAGAHGKEIKDIIEEITVMDYEGNISTFNKERAEFNYRKSIFMNNNYIILKAKFNLSKGNKKEIKEKMKEYAQYRKEKQPIEYPSAGSTFKRGQDFITAQLIDKAGLKGYRIGGAEVSKKHAGFIVNVGEATAKDVLDLIDFVQKEVYNKFGKKIELEIKIIGDF